MATLTGQITGWPIKQARFNITAAEIVALGAGTTGTVVLPFSLPPKAVVVSCAAYNAGTAAATLASLTVTIGDAGDDDRYLAAQTVFAANAGLHRVGQAAVTNASATVNTPITCLFTGNAGLNTLTALSDGVTIIINYVEA